MKQAVADAAVDQIKDGMVLGLGSGSTAALMIKGLGSGLPVETSRTSLGSQPPLERCWRLSSRSPCSVSMPLARLILRSMEPMKWIRVSVDQGGGACHVQEKLVAARAQRFVVVVDSTKSWIASISVFFSPSKCCQEPGAGAATGVIHGWNR